MNEAYEPAGPPMRIAIVGPVYPYKGGVSQFTSILAERLVATDEVLVVSWSRQYPSWLYPGSQQVTGPASSRSLPRTGSGESSALRAPVKFVLDYRNPFSWVRAALLLRRWRADAVVFAWATTFSAPIYLTMMAVLRGTRSGRGRGPILAAICHNVLPHERRPFDRTLTRAVLGRMDVCVLHAHSQEPELSALSRRARPVALFLPEYGPVVAGARVDAGLRRALQLGERVCLFFGYVRPYKGLHHLLEALSTVRQQIDVDLLVVGEFWEDKRAYESAIARLGLADHVRIVDQYVPEAEVASYFAASDVVVLPYVTATQSAVVPLAWSLGKPVISTAVGGIPDVIRDGETGLLVPPADPGALAAAITRFFREDLAETFLPRIRRRASDLSWDRYTGALRAAVSRGGTGT